MGGGASKKAAEPIAKEPTKKTQFAEAETGGASPKQKGSAERRKTQTLRRPAVSTGAELSRKSEDFVATESIPMTPKSEEVTTALLEALEAHPLFEHLPKELMMRTRRALAARTHARAHSPAGRTSLSSHHLFFLFAHLTAHLSLSCARRAQAASRRPKRRPSARTRM